jgi:DNA polymerase-3 subunit alpha
MNFVHLKTQSEFSINQGINRIDSMVAKVAQNNMGALALTDLNGLFGAVGFYKAARSKGIKPIIGVDLTVQQEDGNTYQITVLAKNADGYRSIIELNSKGYTENRTDKVSIKEEWLSNLHDVIVLSGAKQGLIGQSLLKGDFKEAKEIAIQMKQYFGDDFYIELQRDGTKDENAYMDGAVQLCSELNIAPVATNACLFNEPEDFVAHEARYCIANKQPLFSMKREQPFNKEMYLKTKEEMSELFSDLPEALENTVSIAKKCNIELSLDNPKLPNFPTPNGESIDNYFADIARKGLDERLLEDFPDELERNEKKEEYFTRLNWEIETIQKMGFPGYFLIVSDFITWSKEQDIPVGPGRGSGAGSLVAYAMKITDLDPLPYGLFFERFLNPERVSMPDFDIDFCQSRRNEVYEYVRQKYGENSVCQIGTFGTMAAKAVVRDVGRTLGYPYDFIDSLAKLINIKANHPMSLKQFIFGDEDKGILPDDTLLQKYHEEHDVKKLIDIALKLEGITRQVGTHAAGVVISPTILTDFTPLYTASVGASPSTQFNMKDVEKSGLVKFDFLGLTTLTIIKETIDLINDRKSKNKETPFNLKKISLNEPQVYSNIFWQGNTVGIFQFESKGMTSTLQKVKPEILEDLMAVTAIYRPGPMDIIGKWFESRALTEEQRLEQKIYPHESLVDILKETSGFMIYQEQVMKCAQIIAGYSLGGADILRRAMGKKDAKEMLKQRTIFTDGAAKNNIGEEKANEIFDLMEKFAGYGFNKSHAAAYAYISYQTAYLKAFYPEEFFTANLNAQVEKTDTDKIAILIEDAKKNGLKILAPDINQSAHDFTVSGDKEIRYGLGAIKGAGEKAVQVIVADREKNGPFLDFYNFLERVGKGNVNKRVLETLVNSGAFDSINSNRSQLKEGIAEGLDYVTKYKKKRAENISVLGDSLFDDDDAPKKKVTRKKKETPEPIKPSLPDIPEWDELNQAKNEKKALGFFFSANPFDTYYAKQLDGFHSAMRLAKLNSYQPDDNIVINPEDDDDIKTIKDELPSEAFVGGIVEDINWWKSKKGAFVTISDGTSTTTVSMFEDFLNTNKEWLKEDAFVALRIKLQMNYDQVEDKEILRLTTQQGFNFEQVKKMTTNRIFVGCENNPELIKSFDKICNDYVGTLEDKDPVIVLCVDDDKTGRKTKQIKKCFIKAEPKLLEDLVKTFGESWVKVLFKKDVDNIAFPDLPYKNKKNYNNKKKNNFST